MRCPRCGEIIADDAISCTVCHVHIDDVRDEMPLTSGEDAGRAGLTTTDDDRRAHAADVSQPTAGDTFEPSAEDEPELETEDEPEPSNATRRGAWDAPVMYQPLSVEAHRRKKKHHDPRMVRPDVDSLDADAIQARCSPDTVTKVSGQGAEAGTFVPDSAASIPPRKIPRKTVVTITIVAVVALGLAVACGYLFSWYVHEQQEAAASAQAADEATRSLHDVVFAIEAPGYDDATCSPIPVHVTGTDRSGTQYDADYYIDASGAGLSLPRGTYTATSTVSPLMGDGSFLGTSDAQWQIEIGDDVATGESVSLPADQPLVLAPVASMADVTDEQIDRAYKTALESGMSRDRADQLRAALVEARQSAYNAETTATKAESQRIDESQTSSSSSTYSTRSVSTSYYEFSIPSYWRDRVYLVEDGQGGTTVVTNDSGLVVMRVFLVEAGSGGWSGDAGGYSLLYQKDRNGHDVQLDMTGAPYIAWYDRCFSSSPQYSDEELAELLDLTTGGSVTLDDAKGAGSSAESVEASVNAVKVFFEENVKSNMSVY